MSVAPILLLLICAFVLCTAWTETKTYQGYDFDTWEWFDSDLWGPDPNGGHAHLVNSNKAKQLGIYYYSSPGPTYFASKGRQSYVGDPTRYSFRIRNKELSLNPNTLIMVKMSHMPEGCSTWPAFWLYSEDSDPNGSLWPLGGEIDIVEGTHGMGNNNAALHTANSAGFCDFTNQGTTNGGTFTNYDCNVGPSGANKQGCSIKATSSSTFGHNFNINGGGWYALEWTQTSATTGIMNVYMLPSSYQKQTNPNPGAFVSTYGGQIIATYGFNTNRCNPYTFRKMNMVLDLSFCGDYAEATWGQSGCGGASCDAYLKNNNPNQNPHTNLNINAYFAISSVSVYQ